MTSLPSFYRKSMEIDLSPRTMYGEVSKRTAAWVEQKLLEQAEPVTTLERWAMGAELTWNGGRYVNLKFYRRKGDERVTFFSK